MLAAVPLGMAGAALSLRWPLALAGVLWLVAIDLGLILAFAAEPLVWRAPIAKPPTPSRNEAHSPPVAPPRTAPVTPLPLFDLVPLPGGSFRMGSPPATEAEIQGYLPEWAEALEKKPEEVVEDVRNWRQAEEPVHQVRLSPFAIARTPWPVISGGR